MKIRYDAEVDALSIIFRETTVTTQELAEGIAGEYDAQGQLVGIEILDAARRLGDGPALHEVTLEGLGATVPAAVSS
jgi:YD repeat-containing protein